MAVTALRKYGPDLTYSMVPVLTNTTIGRGAAIGLDTNGFARELVAGDEFAGFAEEDIDTTGLASGDRRIRVVDSGTVQLAVAGATAPANYGEGVYASAVDTFTTTSTANSRVGKVSEWISGTTCWCVFQSDARLSL